MNRIALAKPFVSSVLAQPTAMLCIARLFPKKALGSLSLLVLTTFLMLAPALVHAAAVTLPPINGAPCASCAPAGWLVNLPSPDLINGNGLWPGGAFYAISDVSGPSSNGGQMALVLNIEKLQTTLAGLIPGQTYQVSIEWQQATLGLTLGGGTPYTGGSLFMSVDGNATIYPPVGTAATDTWQVTTHTFTAIGTTALLVVGIGTPGFTAIVFDD
ncbi:MAG: hypothetical protein ABUK11_03780 [Mariprofundaceae bacterium]